MPTQERKSIHTTGNSENSVIYKERKTMLYTLTKTELSSIIKEAIENYINSKDADIESIAKDVIDEHKQYIFEMAYKRKEYKEKIDNLSPQIIENWCLIRHCALYNNQNNRVHWGDELKGHLLTVARYNIKGTDRWEDKEQAIREVWNNNDYFEPRTIEYVINNKFRKEGFDRNSEKFLEIIHDCISSFNKLIHLMSLGDINDLYEYVDSL